MNQEEIFNNLLVMLFNEILDVEQKALITGNFKEISINDMHIIVTMGTLTTAINNLVKKGYVTRVRSAEDKRVVLISLTDKGRSAYEKHADFHRRMVQTVMDGFQGEELDVLAAALEKLRAYFREFS